MSRFRVIGVGEDLLGEIEAPDPDTAWGEARRRWPWRMLRIEQLPERDAA